MDPNYTVIIKVQEEGGGTVERTYNYNDQDVVYIEEGGFDEKVEDMIKTLRKSKEKEF